MRTRSLAVDTPTHEAGTETGRTMATSTGKSRTEQELRDQLTEDEQTVAFHDDYMEEAGHLEWLLSAPIQEVRDWAASGVEEIERERADYFRA